jgi:hypothetical protein
MPTITKKNLAERQFGGVPYGNTTTLQFALETNASGAALNSDTTAAIGLGDVVRLGWLPAGAKLQDAQAIVSTTFSASVTGSLGFAYVDGVDSTAVPQDAAYFLSGQALSSTTRARANTAKAPVTLPKDAYLILTTAGAGNAKASKLDVLVEVELIGAP